MKFWGYLRPDGRVGVRNHLLILSTVTCANTVVDKIGRKLDEEDITIIHTNGCGQGGDDLRQTYRTLLGTANHPNVGAVLIIGLGCESLDTNALTSEVAASGKPATCLLIQDEGGTNSTVAKGVAIARELKINAARALRQSVDFSNLIVGTECGASDGYSGISANPAVGKAADLIVAAGGTVILSEVTEMIGAEHLLTRRARDPEVARLLIKTIQKHEREAERAGVNLMGAQINPGNFEGGLSTPEEKSLGAINKGGSSSLVEVVDYAVRPGRRGLIVMDTPGDDVESMVGMAAGGAQIMLFTTGRGSPTGNPITPVVKISSNSLAYQKFLENIDINAGTILEGSETIERVGADIFQQVLAVASGKRTKAELLGHREFAINTIGPKV
jgi:altronate dehydratase large subunit